MNRPAYWTKWNASDQEMMVRCLECGVPYARGSFLSEGWQMVIVEPGQVLACDFCGQSIQVIESSLSERAREVETEALVVLAKATDLLATMLEQYATKMRGTK